MRRRVGRALTILRILFRIDVSLQMVKSLWCYVSVVTTDRASSIRVTQIEAKRDEPKLGRHKKFQIVALVSRGCLSD